MTVRERQLERLALTIDLIAARRAAGKPKPTQRMMEWIEKAPIGKLAAWREIWWKQLGWRRPDDPLPPQE